jgi:CRISPR-associated endoribonuclease Cas6
MTTNLPFSLASFTFHLIAKEAIQLPEYKGSTFRGGFGHALKQVWCLRPQGRICERCQNPTACAYSYIFETPRAFGKETYVVAENLPHPFVLIPPLTKAREIAAGESFAFGLNLFGSGITLVESFIYAFDKLGDIGIGPGQKRFALEKVTNADGSLVYAKNSALDERQVRVINYDELAAQEGEAEDSGRNGKLITLEFLTPTHVIHHGRPTIELTWEFFFRGLLRRASLLAEVHGGTKWELGYKNLIDTACNAVTLKSRNLEWQDWERYSNRQERRMKFWGFVGSVVFEGNLKPYLPLIKLGEYIHLGSKTSFGMGKYEIR